MVWLGYLTILIYLFTPPKESFSLLRVRSNQGIVKINFRIVGKIPNLRQVPAKLLTTFTMPGKTRVNGSFELNMMIYLDNRANFNSQSFRQVIMDRFRIPK